MREPYFLMIRALSTATIWSQIALLSCPPDGIEIMIGGASLDPCVSGTTTTVVRNIFSF